VAQQEAPLAPLASAPAPAPVPETRRSGVSVGAPASPLLYVSSVDFSWRIKLLKRRVLETFFEIKAAKKKVCVELISSLVSEKCCIFNSTYQPPL